MRRALLSRAAPTFMADTHGVDLSLKGTFSQINDIISNRHVAGRGPAAERWSA